MGAVGALGPTCHSFESVGASTNVFGNFSLISFNFYENDMENVLNLAIPWQKVMSSTHSLKFVMGP